MNLLNSLKSVAKNRKDFFGSNNPQLRSSFDGGPGVRYKACTCMPRQIKSFSIYWSFGTIKILMREKKERFGFSLEFHTSEVVGRDQNGKCQASYSFFSFIIEVKTCKLALFGISEVFQCMEQI